jgi:hypothetical protein
MNRDDRDFGISIPYAGQLVYTSLVGCLESGGESMSKVLKLLYGVVPFLCIYAPESSDYYIYPLLRIDGGERVIGLVMYIGIAFAAVGGAPVWSVIQNILGLSRINFIGACLAHAGITSANHDVLAYMMKHTRVWVRRVVFCEIKKHLGEMDESIRRWCVAACGEIGMRDGDEEIVGIAKGVVAGSGFEGDLFQAVCASGGGGVRGMIRGMYHRDEVVRKRSVAGLRSEIGGEWGVEEGSWNALVFSVAFLSKRIGVLRVCGDGARVMANAIERLVTVLSGTLVIGEPVEVLKNVLRVISEPAIQRRGLQLGLVDLLIARLKSTPSWLDDDVFKVFCEIFWVLCEGNAGVVRDVRNDQEFVMILIKGEFWCV